jgi:uncharacterized membrane protein
MKVYIILALFSVLLLGCISNSNESSIKQAQELKQQNIIDVYSVEILAFMGLKEKNPTEPVEPVKIEEPKQFN